MFRYAQESNCKLSNNHKHNFASRFALSLYKRNSIATFIPKNGCTNLRYSIAKDNGFIDDYKNFAWIHSNNFTFSSRLDELVSSDYSFCFLRCPFERLASCFMDKIVEKNIPYWKIVNHLEREGNYVSSSEFNFSDFLCLLEDDLLLNLDEHWTPQISFLVFDKYSDFFSIENFDDAKDILAKKIGFELIDTRSFSKHVSKARKIDIVDAHLLPLDDLYQMKIAGKYPTYRSFYSPELVDKILDIYQHDFEIYNDLFGKRGF